LLQNARNELGAKTESLEDATTNLLRLETWKKSMALIIPESVLSKQLNSIRKEHESGLIAMQHKQTDLRCARDRIVRLEHEVASLNGDLRRKVVCRSAGKNGSCAVTARARTCT